MDILLTIIVIILIIIGIVLFVFLVAEVEFPPPPVISPFQSGTTVRIKSLANNKYLRLANCSTMSNPSYSQCTLTPTQGWLGCTPSSTQIVADAGPGDNGINWSLCEYVGTKVTPGGNAAYTLFQGVANSERVLSYPTPGDPSTFKPVIVSSLPTTCPGFNQNYGLQTPYIGEISVYFSFQLQENGGVGTNEGIYQILDGNPRFPSQYWLDNIMVCSGVKSLSLYSSCSDATSCTPANNCPVIVQMTGRQHILNSGIDPLTYSFVIEQVS